MQSVFQRLQQTLQRGYKRMKPGQMIVLMFMLLIFIGAVLLSLPLASAEGSPTSFLTALFTATSATCVTGLSIFDTGTYWSGFGQVVIILLIQIGGLGFMTISMIFFFALKKKIGLRQRMVLAQALGKNDVSGIVSMVKNVLLGTFAVEGAGALILTVHFWPKFGFGTALKYGVFHAVSAFCNAGFDILGDVAAGGSLCAYQTDWVVNLTLMALIVIGGLGFFVWGDIRQARHTHRLSVYTKLVLVISGILIFGGAALFAALEWDNAATIGTLSAGDKLLAALFESVSTRTAGFAAFSQGAMTDSSKAVADLLMFIGGSSGSTAGGVKTVTLGIVILAAIQNARGSSRVTVLRRTIPHEQVSNAITIVILMFTLAFSGALAISVANSCSFSSALFETISALATVGLSTGLTGLLTPVSQIIIILFMFFGRVGIMTISVGFLMTNRAEERMKYADTKILIG